MGKGKQNCFWDVSEMQNKVIKHQVLQSDCGIHPQVEPSQKEKFGGKTMKTFYVPSQCMDKEVQITAESTGYFEIECSDNNHDERIVILQDAE